MEGKGPGVLEIVEDHRGDTYRAVYTVKFKNACVGVACVPEEVAERHKDGADRCGIGLSETEGRERGLRGEIWRTEKTVR